MYLLQPSAVVVLLVVAALVLSISSVYSEALIRIRLIALEVAVGVFGVFVVAFEQALEFGARSGVHGVVVETPFEGLDGAVDGPLGFEPEAEVVSRCGAPGRCKE